jgi:hypothetical protein
MGQINQYMDNFIYSFLLKKQQNGLKTNQTKGVCLTLCCVSVQKAERKVRSVQCNRMLQFNVKGVWPK